MKIKIKDCAGNVLFECEAESIKAAVEKAVKAYVDLRGANLRGANLDYSCLPLWCGSKAMKVDAIIAAQVAAHFCALDCKDKGFIKARKAILKFAQTSHRAQELGLLEVKQ